MKTAGNAVDAITEYERFRPQVSAGAWRELPDADEGGGLLLPAAGGGEAAAERAPVEALVAVVHVGRAVGWTGRLRPVRLGVPVVRRDLPRELVWLLGKTCSWRGCDHRVDLQVDHLDEHSRDGPTDQDNAGVLHGRHNRYKTSHRYTITRDQHGLLHIWRPDGTEIC